MNNLSELLTDTQFNIVFNMLSLGVASMLFTTFFLVLARDRVLPRYRLAVLISATVTGIAAYHYFRMFDSFNHAFSSLDGAVNNAAVYNVGYRYVDWLLTVPLLLVETVAVLALTRQLQGSLLKRLVPAAALMIVLGYPGDAKLDLWGIAPSVWGLLSTIPFLYIMYILFVELGKSLVRQSEPVRKKIKLLRILLIATWGVYPITFILAMNSDGFNADQFVAREVGYTIADILAKCLFGLLIFSIARMKSAEDDAEFAKTEFRD
ncbi:bacteriorhodopsin [Aurantimicrobium minutum]|jgi:bacteriorhodopsin|uniref:bacteriorhodopsin-like n=1 Tax=Aurantimicrobium minutum TaxID=708131 RepID=UPI0024763728|nr:bacteriorhodopsin-like [Aurantimicrobium minutum]MDH6410269.1 bacteriorhodopsin [Aurantimicrobium minutum]